MQDNGTTKYHIGRFAPSPSGGLHFGSLVAATASYLQAKLKGGRWYLRIEDLDPPREEPGAKDKIIRTLDAYKFAWDGAIIYQSNNLELYTDTLNTLKAKGLVYACNCSRKFLKSHPIYPGNCRVPGLFDEDAASRIKVDSSAIEINDLIQGKVSWQLEKDIGDFIIKRRDGLFSYQLAVVVDDAELGVSEVVRGLDLLNQTPKQIFLQHKLDLTTPVYSHTPLAIHPDGDKLSKQTKAEELKTDDKSITKSLFKVLDFLGQNPPTELARETADNIWLWSMSNWDIRKSPRIKGPVPL